MSAGLRQGKNPLSYLGVDPSTPPMMIIEQRDPTDNDYSNYEIGSLWVVTSVPKMWLMVKKNPSATDKWVQVYPGDGSGTNFFETNLGTASENAGTIKIKGVAGGVLTSMAIMDQVSLALDDDLVVGNSLTINTMNEGVVVSDSGGLLSSAVGTDLQFLVGETGNAPSFATLVSENFTVTIANGTVPGTVNIQATGGGGGSGFAGLIGENSVLATPLAEKVSVLGDELADDVSNIRTEASGNKINIIHSDMLNLGDTTSNGKSGVIKLNSNIYFSAYGSNNLFIGKESGSLSLNIISSTMNVGIGSYVLRDIDTSAANTAIGYNSLSSLDSGDGGNCCLGYNTGSSIQTGENNILIGNSAGSDFSSNESGNIIIGDNVGISGTNYKTIIGYTSSTDCYMSGIYGSSGLSSTNGVVVIDEDNKLASSKGTTGQVLTSTATGVTWASGGTGGSHYGFYAYQTDATSSIYTGTNYFLGTEIVFDALLNQGSAFYIGDGTSIPASYTAPETGLYQFNCIMYIVFNKSPLQYVVKYRGLWLHTPSQDFFQSFTAQQYSSSDTSCIYTFNFIAPLTLGDEVTWEIQNTGYYPGEYLSVLGKGSGGNDGIGTSISGYLI